MKIQVDRNTARPCSFELSPKSFKIYQTLHGFALNFVIFVFYKDFASNKWIGWIFYLNLINVYTVGFNNSG